MQEEYNRLSVSMSGGLICIFPKREGHVEGSVGIRGNTVWGYEERSEMGPEIRSIQLHAFEERNGWNHSNTAMMVRIPVPIASNLTQAKIDFN